MIPFLLGNVLSEVERRELETHWGTEGAPDDYWECMQDIVKTPSDWRSICDMPTGIDESDTQKPYSPGTL